jgi:cystathionine beta-lyase
MDFAAPPPVIDALQQRIAHGVFGYGHPWPTLTESVLAHLKVQYGWRIEPEWIVWLPGLVTGLNVACRAVDGDVLTATPIYPPFLSAPRFSGRALHRAELACSDGRWQWDKTALEMALTLGPPLIPWSQAPACSCSATRTTRSAAAGAEEELRDLAAFAGENDLVVCSDEIHCGLILDADKRHIPFASLSPDAASAASR